MKPSTSLYLLDNGQPAISCFNLTGAELQHRLNAAHARADAQGAAEHPDHPAEAVRAGWAIGRGTLWHENFPAGFRVTVSDNDLFRLTACLPSELLAANGGQPLDFWDYAYLADILREALSYRDAPRGDRQSLRRALAWVEQKGAGQRNEAAE